MKSRVRKKCMAWPDSCIKVRTSFREPVAFIKMKGILCTCSGMLYPPGLLPGRDSISSRFWAFIIETIAPN